MVGGCGGWWLVADGWWLVADGWWLVADDWWLVAGGTEDAGLSVTTRDFRSRAFELPLQKKTEQRVGRIHALCCGAWLFFVVVCGVCAVNVCVPCVCVCL